MASLFRAYVSGTDFENYPGPFVAPAPSGDAYLAFLDSNLDGHFARVGPSGVAVWGSTLPAAFVVGVASNATHVVVACATASGVGLAKRDSSNASVWQTELPVGADSGTIFSVAMNAAGKVAVFAHNLAGSETVLALLHESTGAITWAVNLRTAGGDAGFKPHGVAFLSGGDLVVSFLRAGGQTVQRVSAADGSAVWTRTITGAGGYGIPGVDASDSIYVVGDDFGSPTKLPVLKLDSSGSTVWARQFAQPAGLFSAGLSFITQGALTAGTTEMLVPMTFAGASTKYSGFVSFPLDGVIATGNARLVQFTGVSPHAFLPPAAAPRAGDSITMAFQDVDTTAKWVVLFGGSSAAEDAAWGPYTRTTWAADIEAGSMSASVASYTRETTGSFTASSYSLPTASATMQLDTYTSYSVAGSVPLSTSFGTPALDNGPHTPTWVVSTAFGAPLSVVVLTATGVPVSTSFGTAAYDPLHATTATSVAPATAFGTPGATRGTAPAPHDVTGIAAPTAFGTPVRSGAATVAPAGVNSTAFGVPTAGPKVAPEGFNIAAAFGTPTLRNAVSAEGSHFVAQFGLPIGGGLGGAFGFMRTAFGTPSSSAHATHSASGVPAPQFGTPAVMSAFRTRSAYFRTRFGQAQAERTAP